MYVDSCQIKKKYVRHLLRENYREDGKVKHRTIANLSKCPGDVIDAIKLALKHKSKLQALYSIAEDITLQQGKSFGAVWLVNDIAKQLGIEKALTHSRNGKLALWQTVARVINQGSRLSAVRLASTTLACDILGITETFNEDDLYSNLDWISEEQSKIEDRLFKQRDKSNNNGLYLYDVTSSYLEGQYNELSAFGYNRDGKRGKKQIVIGLLCDSSGVPLSVEAFDGNRHDTTTVASQIHKIAKRFSGTSVTFVGDRGMIKSKQVEDLFDHGIHYITAITKAQIEALLKYEIIQMSLFDHDIAEVEMEDGLRYIIRRNPFRATEIKSIRDEKLNTLSEKVKAKNKYLSEHPRAKTEVAKKSVEEELTKLKLGKWVSIENEERTLKVVTDNDALEEVSKLDGCYVLKTDLKKEMASTDIVHSRYQALSLVERAFRTMKTDHLEVRPIHVRLKKRTQGHVFIVMLAYLIIQELAKRWRDLNITVEEGLRELGTLTVTDLLIRDEVKINLIPKPSPLVAKLLKCAKVSLPGAIPSRGVNVATRRKLSKTRLNP